MNRIAYIITAAVLLLLTGCSNSDEQIIKPGLPKKGLPEGVSFESFSPDRAKVGDLITVSGSGFGNDLSNVTVELNYRQAQIETVSDNTITFLVPENTTNSGSLRIKLLDKEVNYVFENKFKLRRFMKGRNVSTLGQVNAEFNSDYMLYHPQEKMFILQCPWRANVLFKDGVSYQEPKENRGSSFKMQPSISPDGEIIYQAVDNLNGGSWAAAIVMFKREDGFKKEYICQPFKQSDKKIFHGIVSVAVNPKDGELFFYTYKNYAAIYRWDRKTQDITKQFDPQILKSSGTYDSSGILRLKFSKDGSKLYLSYPKNGGEIWVSDYDSSTKTLSQDKKLTGNAAEAGDFADGKLSTAAFRGIGGVDTDSQGNIYVCDSYNHCIRKIDTDGNVTTYAGRPGIAGSNNGEVGKATFNTPIDIAVEEVDGKVILYVLDKETKRIRKIEDVEEEVDVED